MLRQEATHMARTMFLRQIAVEEQLNNRTIAACGIYVTCIVENSEKLLSPLPELNYQQLCQFDLPKITVKSLAVVL